MLGLRFCARAFSSCSKRGPFFIAMRGPLTIVASLVAEHRLQTRRLSSCDSRTQLLCGMWDLPRPGLEPLSLALAGRFSTTEPPGEPLSCILTGSEGNTKASSPRLSSILSSGWYRRWTALILCVQITNHSTSFILRWTPPLWYFTYLESGCHTVSVCIYCNFISFFY